MILIADSGSTKCSWALCDTEGNLIQEISTIGFNPYFIDHLSIISHLEKSELNQYKKKITYVFFYGAGCSSKEKNQIIELPFEDFFKNAEITISHDLDAACFAMYNGIPSITCILGTGSNSCFYDGKEILEHGPSLGFIVGDEASGNYFGKKVISMYFNNVMPQELKEILESSYETDITTINKNVYNTNRANVFLSKYFPFIIETKNHPLIQRLIKDTLDEFINLHVKCFSNYNEVKINFIGSVAYFLSEEIHDAAKRNNLKAGKILKNPIKKLIEFHFEKIKETNI
jgi:N-acetylglucosamine kinase-like BadF-type ATPase